MKIPYIASAAIRSALDLLPKAMDSKEARVLLYAIGLQESRFEHRRQMNNGPARGFWQFEEGTEKSRGGVAGVYFHPASAYWLRELCILRNCPFKIRDIYKRIETDDVLAAGVARLLLFTDAKRLPLLNQEEQAWNLYAERCWRPGKPHKATWHEAYNLGIAQVEKESI